MSSRPTQRAAGEAGEQHHHPVASSSAAARTCRTTCTRPRTASPAAAPRSSARTGPSATSRARRPAARRSRSTSTGNYVEWTTRAATNTLVTRFSIPDSAGGGGIDSTLNVYVDGTLPQGHRPHLEVRLAVRQRDQPRQLAGLGRAPAHLRRGERPARHRPSRRAARSGCRRTRPTPATYAIDFVNLEQVDADRPTRTRPSTSCRPASRTRTCRTRWTRSGWTPPATWSASTCPAGDYQTASKFQVYGKAVKVVGAGPWFTRFHAPSDAGEHRHRLPGRGARRTARRSRDFAYFGNYTSRIDGPGKVFDFANVSDIDDRQHLDRAHGLPVLGRQHRRHRRSRTRGSATCSPTAST